MAKEKTKVITMRPGCGVIGEKRKHLLPCTTHEVSEPFADQLIERGKAVEGKEKFKVPAARTTTAASSSSAATETRLAALEEAADKRFGALEKALQDFDGGLSAVSAALGELEERVAPIERQVAELAKAAKGSGDAKSGK